MNALNLLHCFDAVFLMAMAAWVGSILFVSFGLAPLIPRVLEPEPASRFAKALFPRYYLWGTICGAIALPAVVCGPLAVPELRGPMVGLQALLIVAGLLIMFYCGNVLTPALNAARDAGPAAREPFDRLQSRSTNLNSIVLVMGAFLLAAYAYRPPVRTDGIRELNAEENRRLYYRRNAENRQLNQQFYSQYTRGVPGRPPTADAEAATTSPTPASLSPTVDPLPPSDPPR